MLRRVVIVVGVALVGGAACSGGSSSGGSSSGESETVPRAAADPSGEVPDATESDTEFCGAIEAIQSADFELEETFGVEARALFDDVRDAAPPEIAGDVETVIETLDALAELGISVDDDDPAALDAAFEILVDPVYTEANSNLAAYTSDACGIDLVVDDDGDIDLDDLEGFDEN